MLPRKLMRSVLRRPTTNAAVGQGKEDTVALSLEVSAPVKDDSITCGGISALPAAVIATTDMPPLMRRGSASSAVLTSSSFGAFMSSVSTSGGALAEPRRCASHSAAISSTATTLGNSSNHHTNRHHQSNNYSTRAGGGNGNGGGRTAAAAAGAPTATRSPSPPPVNTASRQNLSTSTTRNGSSNNSSNIHHDHRQQQQQQPPTATSSSSLAAPSISLSSVEVLQQQLAKRFYAIVAATQLQDDTLRHRAQNLLLDSAMQCGKGALATVRSLERALEEEAHAKTAMMRGKDKMKNSNNNAALRRSSHESSSSSSSSASSLESSAASPASLLATLASYRGLLKGYQQRMLSVVELGTIARTAAPTSSNDSSRRSASAPLSPSANSHRKQPNTTSASSSHQQRRSGGLKSARRQHSGGSAVSLAAEHTQLATIHRYLSECLQEVEGVLIHHHHQQQQQRQHRHDDDAHDNDEQHSQNVGPAAAGSSSNNNDKNGTTTMPTTASSPHIPPLPATPTPAFIAVLELFALLHDKAPLSIALANTTVVTAWQRAFEAAANAGRSLSPTASSAAMSSLGGGSSSSNVTTAIAEGNVADDDVEGGDDDANNIDSTAVTAQPPQPFLYALPPRAANYFTRSHRCHVGHANTTNANTATITADSTNDAMLDTNNSSSAPSLAVPIWEASEAIIKDYAYNMAHPLPTPLLHTLVAITAHETKRFAWAAAAIAKRLDDDMVVVGGGSPLAANDATATAMTTSAAATSTPSSASSSSASSSSASSPAAQNALLHSTTGDIGDLLAQLLVESAKATGGPWEQVLTLLTTEVEEGGCVGGAVSSRKVNGSKQQQQQRKKSSSPHNPAPSARMFGRSALPNSNEEAATDETTTTAATVGEDVDVAGGGHGKHKRTRTVPEMVRLLRTMHNGYGHQWRENIMTPLLSLSRPAQAVVLEGVAAAAAKAVQSNSSRKALSPSSQFRSAASSIVEPTSPASPSSSSSSSHPSASVLSYASRNVEGDADDDCQWGRRRGGGHGDADADGSDASRLLFAGRAERQSLVSYGSPSRRYLESMFGIKTNGVIGGTDERRSGADADDYDGTDDDANQQHQQRKKKKNKKESEMLRAMNAHLAASEKDRESKNAANNLRTAVVVVDGAGGHSSGSGSMLAGESATASLPPSDDAAADAFSKSIAARIAALGTETALWPSIIITTTGGGGALSPQPSSSSSSSFTGQQQLTASSAASADLPTLPGLIITPPAALMMARNSNSATASSSPTTLADAFVTALQKMRQHYAYWSDEEGMGPSSSFSLSTAAATMPTSVAAEHHRGSNRNHHQHYHRQQQQRGQFHHCVREDLLQFAVAQNRNNNNNASSPSSASLSSSAPNHDVLVAASVMSLLSNSPADFAAFISEVLSSAIADGPHDTNNGNGSSSHNNNVGSASADIFPALRLRAVVVHLCDFVAWEHSTAYLGALLVPQNNNSPPTSAAFAPGAIRTILSHFVAQTVSKWVADKIAAECANQHSRTANHHHRRPSSSSSSASQSSSPPRPIPTLPISISLQHELLFIGAYTIAASAHLDPALLTMEREVDEERSGAAAVIGGGGGETAATAATRRSAAAPFIVVPSLPSLHFTSSIAATPSQRADRNRALRNRCKEFLSLLLGGGGGGGHRNASSVSASSSIADLLVQHQLWHKQQCKIFASALSRATHAATNATATDVMMMESNRHRNGPAANDTNNSSSSNNSNRNAIEDLLRGEEQRLKRRGGADDNDSSGTSSNNYGGGGSSNSSASSSSSLFASPSSAYAQYAAQLLAAPPSFTRIVGLLAESVGFNAVVGHNNNSNAGGTAAAAGGIGAGVVVTTDLELVTRHLVGIIAKSTVGGQQQQQQRGTNIRIALPLAAVSVSAGTNPPTTTSPTATTVTREFSVAAETLLLGNGSSSAASSSSSSIVVVRERLAIDSFTATRLLNAADRAFVSVINATASTASSSSSGEEATHPTSNGKPPSATTSLATILAILHDRLAVRSSSPSQSFGLLFESLDWSLALIRQRTLACSGVGGAENKITRLPNINNDNTNNGGSTSGRYSSSASASATASPAVMSLATAPLSAIAARSFLAVFTSTSAVADAWTRNGISREAMGKIAAADSSVTAAGPAANAVANSGVTFNIPLITTTATRVMSGTGGGEGGDDGEGGGGGDKTSSSAPNPNRSDHNNPPMAAITIPSYQTSLRAVGAAIPSRAIVAPSLWQRGLLLDSAITAANASLWRRKEEALTLKKRRGLLQRYALERASAIRLPNSEEEEQRLQQQQQQEQALLSSSSFKSPGGDDTNKSSSSSSVSSSSASSFSSSPLVSSSALLAMTAQQVFDLAKEPVLEVNPDGYLRDGEQLLSAVRDDAMVWATSITSALDLCVEVIESERQLFESQVKQWLNTLSTTTTTTSSGASTMTATTSSSLSSSASLSPACNATLLRIATLFTADRVSSLCAALGHLALEASTFAVDEARYRNYSYHRHKKCRQVMGQKLKNIAYAKLGEEKKNPNQKHFNHHQRGGQTAAATTSRGNDNSNVYCPEKTKTKNNRGGGAGEDGLSSSSIERSIQAGTRLMTLQSDINGLSSPIGEAIARLVAALGAIDTAHRNALVATYNHFSLNQPNKQQQQNNNASSAISHVAPTSRSVFLPPHPSTTAPPYFLDAVCLAQFIVVCSRMRPATLWRNAVSAFVELCTNPIYRVGGGGAASAAGSSSYAVDNNSIVADTQLNVALDRTLTCLNFAPIPYHDRCAVAMKLMAFGRSMGIMERQRYYSPPLAGVSSSSTSAQQQQQQQQQTFSTSALGGVLTSFSAESSSAAASGGSCATATTATSVDNSSSGLVVDSVDPLVADTIGTFFEVTCLRRKIGSRMSNEVVASPSSASTTPGSSIGAPARWCHVMPYLNQVSRDVATHTVDALLGSILLDGGEKDEVVPPSSSSHSSSEEMATSNNDGGIAASSGPPSPSSSAASLAAVSAHLLHASPSSRSGKDNLHNLLRNVTVETAERRELRGVRMSLLRAACSVYPFPVVKRRMPGLGLVSHDILRALRRDHTGSTWRHAVAFYDKKVAVSAYTIEARGVHKRRRDEEGWMGGGGDSITPSPASSLEEDDVAPASSVYSLLSDYCDSSAAAAAEDHHPATRKSSSSSSEKKQPPPSLLHQGAEEEATSASSSSFYNALDGDGDNYDDEAVERQKLDSGRRGEGAIHDITHDEEAAADSAAAENEGRAQQRLAEQSRRDERIQTALRNFSSDARLNQNYSPYDAMSVADVGRSHSSSSQNDNGAHNNSTANSSSPAARHHYRGSLNKTSTGSYSAPRNKASAAADHRRHQNHQNRYRDGSSAASASHLSEDKLTAIVHSRQRHEAALMLACVRHGAAVEAEAAEVMGRGRSSQSDTMQSATRLVEENMVRIATSIQWPCDASPMPPRTNSNQQQQQHSGSAAAAAAISSSSASSLLLHPLDVCIPLPSRPLVKSATIAEEADREAAAAAHAQRVKGLERRLSSRK